MMAVSNRAAGRSILGIFLGTCAGNVSAASDALLNGDRSLKLSGQFSAGLNTSGVSQGITVSPGDLLQASASALIRSIESLANTSNLAQMRIEYYNQYGGVYGSANFLGEIQSTVADSSTTNDTWLTRQLTGIVPAGATEARLVIQFMQPNGQTGAVHFDNVAFGIVDQLPLAGDYDHNGTVDPADYNVWRNSFGSSIDLDADGNYNGVVDAADYVVWRKGVGAMLAGAGASSLTNVPEPGGFTIAVGAAFGWFFNSLAFSGGTTPHKPTAFFPALHKNNMATSN